MQNDMSRGVNISPTAITAIILTALSVVVGVVLGLSLHIHGVEGRLPNYEYTQRDGLDLAEINHDAVNLLATVVLAGEAYAPLDEARLHAQRSDARLAQALGDAIVHRGGWVKTTFDRHNKEYRLVAVAPANLAVQLLELPDMSLAERQQWLDRGWMPFVQPDAGADLRPVRIVVERPRAQVGPFTGSVTDIRHWSAVAVILTAIFGAVLALCWGVLAVTSWDNRRTARAARA